jgi:hypothetical protein
MNTDRVGATRLDPGTTATAIVAANLVTMLITSSFLERARRVIAHAVRQPRSGPGAVDPEQRSLARSCGRIRVRLNVTSMQNPWGDLSQKLPPGRTISFWRRNSLSTA